MKYQIKPKFVKAVAALFPNVDKVDYFYNNSEIYNKLIDLDVLDEFAHPVWEAPTFGAEPPPLKIQLMLTLNSWADFHNGIDEYEPDYTDDESDKHGLAIETIYNEDDNEYDSIVVITSQKKIDNLLFDACVSSYKRAEEMHELFSQKITETLL